MQHTNNPQRGSAFRYLDFELLILPGMNRDFPVSVLRSPEGEARATMHFPFDEPSLELHLGDLRAALRSSGEERRHLDPPGQASQQDRVRAFGEQLFDALFSGEVRDNYYLSRQKAEREHHGLRLKLRIEAPELATVPWEFLYDPREDDYVCLSRKTPQMRYLPIPKTIRPLEAQPPLRILGMIASPTDLPALDTAREKRRVEEAVKGLKAGGLIELVWLEGQTSRDLLRALRGGPWHIFHFIGHGGFDPGDGQGFIALADEEGRSDRLKAVKLGRLLADQESLRLAVLNCCEGAKGSERDVLSSTAATLVRRGIPAVLAMQYEISDAAAIQLARSFYEGLVEGMPVDAAVAEARKMVSVAEDTVEWGTPVLFMRGEGRIFELSGVIKAELPQEEPAIIDEELGQRREPGCEETEASLARVKERMHPSLALQLPVRPRQVEAGAMATWTVTVRNDGDDDLRDVSVRRGEALLEEPFELAAGKGRRFTFTTTYEGGGTKTEKVTASGVASNGESVHDAASATVQVRAADRPIITSPIHLELRRIPAGEFWMGSDPAKDKYARQHRVHLSEFYIGKYAVTNTQYQAFVSATGREAPRHWSGGRIPSGRENHPVVNVSWHDAVAFCQWLSKETGSRVRLPTEAEWEKAARGTDGRVYPWGNEWDESRANVGGASTTPVGHYSPWGDSPYGVADMAGNVWEWTQSLYKGYPYDPDDGREDLEPVSLRVLRGGSFFSNGNLACCAFRFGLDPLDRDRDYGFRVVVSPI